MADEFGVKINLNTKDATKKVKDLNKEAEKLGENLEEKKDVKIEGEEAVNLLKKIDQSILEINAGLQQVEKKSKTFFNLGSLAAGIYLLKQAVSLFKGAYNAVSATAHKIVSLSNTAQGLGIKINTLKAFETAFKSVGLSAQDADNALGSLQDTLTGQLLNPSTQIASSFAMMGVNLRKSNGDLKDSAELMEELAKSFKNFKEPYAVAYGRQFGLSREEVIQMRNNPTYAKTLAAQKGNQVVTSPEEKAARKMVAQEAELGVSIEKLKNDAMLPLMKLIGDKLIPAVTSIANILGGIFGEKAPTVENLSKDTATAASAIFHHPIDSAKQIFNSLLKPGAGQYVSSGIEDLKAAAKSQGLSDPATAAMLELAQRESKLKNIPSDAISKYTGKPVAGGYLQYKDSTIAGYGGKNAYSAGDTAKAFKNEYAEFQSIARKQGIKPSLDQLAMFHHLGAPHYKKALKYFKNHQGATVGSFYNQIDSSGYTASLNKGMVNQRFPVIEQATPMATQSSNVSNTVNNQQRVANINSSTSIGNVHVNANNPQQFAQGLRQNMGYLDKMLNMNGLQT